jgi:hypothetical protein
MRWLFRRGHFPRGRLAAQRSHWPSPGHLGASVLDAPGSREYHILFSSADRGSLQAGLECAAHDTTKNQPTVDHRQLRRQQCALRKVLAASYHRSQWTIVSRGWRAAGRKSVPTV